MSQGLDYAQVVSIQAQNFQKEFGPIITQIMNTAPEEVVAGVLKCCAHKHKKTHFLLAPSELKAISAEFKQYQAKMVETMGEETGMKVAAIATLMNSEPNLLVSEPEVITSKLQNIIAAETLSLSA